MTLQGAALELAEAEAQYQQAEAVLFAAQTAHHHAREVFDIAGKRLTEAVQNVVAAIEPRTVTKTVKRPATLGGDLLGLDDNGGH
jgi:predicted NBD/HSP70 family sugar kinase